MSRLSFSNCLLFCKRAVAVSLLFSSLVCASWAPVSATQPAEEGQSLSAPTQNDNLTASIKRAIQSRTVSEYTISNAASSMVPAGTYTNILVDSAFSPAATTPYISVANGAVTINGGPNIQLVSPLRIGASSMSQLKNTPFLIGSSSAQTSLRLVEGSLTSNIMVGAAGSSQAATLLIGDGKSQNKTVNISGLVYGNGRASSVLQTDGSDLNLSGRLGWPNTTYMLGEVNAALGNITVTKNSDARNGLGDLNALTVRVGEGQKIEVEASSQMVNIFLDKKASFIANGIIHRGDGRVDVHSVVDGGASGALAEGSVISTPNDSIWLWQGLTKGSGELNAGVSMGSHKGLDPDPHAEEIPLNPLTQGDEGHLTLTAGLDISAGEISADKISAGRDIVAGTEFGTKTTQANRVFINRDKTNGTFSPRSTISTQSISAPNGGIYAGQLDVKGGEPSLVSAKNLLVVKMAAETSPATLPSSTGNFTLDNGAFKLTGAKWTPTTGNSSSSSSLSIDYGAQVEGDMTVTRNGASSFTTMKVGGAASVSGGSLDGQSLTANKIALANVGTLAITDTLNSDTTLTITGNGVSAVKNTVAGGDSQITGGSYSGDALTAANAAFANLSILSFTDQLKAGNITITGNGKAEITKTTADKNFSISGGTLQGDSLTSHGNASFSSMTAAGLTNATVNGTFTATDGGETSFNTLSVDKTVNITNGSLKAGQITTGTAANGDFTLSGGSFTFGVDNASPSAIHGSLAATDNDASYFNNLVVDNGVSIGGGYLEGAYLKAASGVFDDNAVIHVDKLELTGADTPLDIKEGSIVTVREISAKKGVDVISTSGLIIIGDENSETRADLGVIDLETSSVLSDQNRVIVSAQSISGKGQGARIDDIRVHQLQVREGVNITDANLQLTGIGHYASDIAKDLIVSQNGDTTLGDMKVGGKVDISGGTVKARQLTVQADAVFDGVGLTLLGAGDKASQVGGNLVITNNGQSSLADLTISGDASISGGQASAQNLAAKSAKFSGSMNAKIRSLILGGQDGSFLQIGDSKEDNSTLTADFVDLKGAPLSIKGPGALQVNKNSQIEGSGNLAAGSIELLAGGQVLADGDIAAESAQLGGEAARIEGASVRISQPLKSMAAGNSISASGGDILLEGGAEQIDGLLSAKAGPVGTGRIEAKNANGAYLDIIQGSALDLVADGNIEAKNITVSTLKTASGNVVAHEGSINIAGSGSSIGGDLIAEKNSASSLGSITVAGATKFAGGSLTATKLTTGSASLSDIRASFDNLVLNSPAENHSFTVVNNSTPADSARWVDAGSLVLNGGAMRIGGGTTPVAVAIGQFGNNSSIDGHIGVSANGQVILGARDLSMLSAPTSIVTGANAVFALASAMRMGAGYGIHVTGAAAAAPVANQIKFDSASLFVIEGGKKSVFYNYLGKIIPSVSLSASNGAVGALSSEKASTASIGNGAQIYIRNPVANTVIVALGENIQTNYEDQQAKTRAAADAPWTGANLSYDNKDKVKVERLNGEYAGQFLVTSLETPTPESPAQPGTPSQPDQPKPSQTHPGAHPGIHDVITNETGKGTVGKDPEHHNHHNGTGFISHTITHDNPIEATRIVESGLRTIILGGVPQMALTANGASSAAMGNRVGIEGLLWRGDDLHARSVSLWAVPLYKNSRTWGLEAGNFDYDYYGGLGGIAIGGDITYEDYIRAGLAFNIGGGYSKSGGELLETSNNMSFWGLGAYAGWVYGNFGLAAEVNFTSSYNKIKQDVSMLNGWSDLKTDARAYVLTAGLDLEYMLRTDWLDIIPHAGFRYNYIHVDDYEIRHRGSTIIKGNEFSQNIWTFPMGIRASREFALDNGWHIKPALDLRVIPAAGDIEAKTSTRFTNTDTDIQLRTKIMDYAVWGGSASLEAAYGSFTLGISYSMEAGAHSLNNSVMGTLRYEF